MFVMSAAVKSRQRWRNTIGSAGVPMRGQHYTGSPSDASEIFQMAKVTQNLYNGGPAPLADLQQAQAQVETARTQAADVRLQRSQTEHAIAVLLGESASAFHLDPRPLSLDVTPPVVDAGLPSALLERRPDVAAAER